MCVWVGGRGNEAEEGCIRAPTSTAATAPVTAWYNPARIAMMRATRCLSRRDRQEGERWRRCWCAARLWSPGMRSLMPPSAARVRSSEANAASEGEQDGRCTQTPTTGAMQGAHTVHTHTRPTSPQPASPAQLRPTELTDREGGARPPLRHLTTAVEPTVQSNAGPLCTPAPTHVGGLSPNALTARPAMQSDPITLWGCWARRHPPM